MKLRNLILTVHGAIGIAIGLLFMVISLTGASIVFHEEIDHSLNRSLFYVTPQAEQVTLDAMLAPVQAARPDLPLWFIETPTEPNQSYVINQKLPNEHRLQTFVNPYTGDVLGVRVWEYSLTGFLYVVHYKLFAGTVGQILVGITGILLLLMTLTGLMLWTGWRKLINGFKIRWHSPVPLLSYDLHKVGGVLSSLFLTMLAFTGVVIVMFQLLPVFAAKPATQAAPTSPPVALSELMQTANAAMPEGKTTFIGFSDTEPKQILVRKRLPDQETGEFDLSTVELDRYSGKLVQATRVTQPDGLFKLLIPIAMLHFGKIGGLPARILYVLIGLMPTLLLITGIITWKRRRWLNARRDSALKLAAETQKTSA